MAFLPDEIDVLLNPTSVAIVGASENSVWATSMVANLRGLGFPGQLHMVNPRRDSAFGQPAFPSISEVPQSEPRASGRAGVSLTVQSIGGRDSDT